jgi:hypothetical protein
VFCPKVPITTVLFANTSSTGKPAIVFTDIKESDRSSDISNNRPLVPSTEKIVVLAMLPEPITLTTSAEPDAVNVFPLKVNLASPLNGVGPFPVAVTIKLSVLLVIATAAEVP